MFWGFWIFFIGQKPPGPPIFWKSSPNQSFFFPRKPLPLLKKIFFFGVFKFFFPGKKHRPLAKIYPKGNFKKNSPNRVFFQKHPKPKCPKIVLAFNFYSSKTHAANILIFLISPKRSPFPIFSLTITSNFPQNYFWGVFLNFFIGKTNGGPIFDKVLNQMSFAKKHYLNI